MATDPTTSSSSGVTANARLTTLTGAVLLVLLFLEGATVLSVGRFITPHIVIGVLLIGPVALKLGSTGYKIVRYYTGSAAYVVAGPPPILRRLLAPVVMVTTVALLGSGVLVMLAGPGSSSRMLFLHKASFVLWFAAMAIHVLLHLGRVARGVGAEFSSPSVSALPGRGLRALLAAASLVVGSGLALWSLSYAHVWAARR
jgi:hypothetical protein